MYFRESVGLDSADFDGVGAVGVAVAGDDDSGEVFLAVFELEVAAF